jgi:hypothetical protein
MPPQPQKFPMRLSINKIPNKPDLFEFRVATPTLSAQFRLFRKDLNQLRIMVEKALMQKNPKPKE